MNVHKALNASITQSAARLGRWALMCLATCMLSACGFKMQGVTPLPFDSLFITIPANTQFGADVRRAIRAASPNTKLIEVSDITLTLADFTEDDDTEDPRVITRVKRDKAMKIAQAQLVQVAEIRNTRQVSLNAQGQVEEYELTLRFTFRLVDSRRQIILPDTTLNAVRSLPFDVRFVQAKEGEQATLFKDMQRSLVARIVRRMTAPEVAERWDLLKSQESQNAELEFTAPDAPTVQQIPGPWQNPSLTPLPGIINSAPQ